jgi:hypothetical protein
LAWLGPVFSALAIRSRAINPLSEAMSEKKASKLDTLETNGIARPPESYRKFCQTNCKDELLATQSLYSLFDIEHSSARLEAFNNCRTEAYFVRNKLTGKVRVRSKACHLRWCPMCAATRRWFMTQQVSTWLKTASQPKFLTLTLSHSATPLAEQLTHLYSSFRRLRKLNLLKQSIAGGVWFFQIHKAKSDDLWHPHLHCVIDSGWIDKYELSAAWELVTKDSKIVDIKEVKDDSKMAGYVARYAARPSMLTSLDVLSRIELAEALHGKRLVGCWGNARSISLRPSKPPDADDWIDIGSWNLVTALVDDDDRARAIWHAYKDNSECPDDCNLRDFEDEILGLEKWGTGSVDIDPQKWLDFW